MLFNLLPREIICKILSFLTYQELMILTKVSKTWNELAVDPWLWRNFQLQVNRGNLDSLSSILSIHRFASVSHLSCLHCQLEDRHLKDIFDNNNIKHVDFLGCDFMLVCPEVLAMTLNN